MNVQQAIRSSANVIRVTNINAGDVYKRFDSNYDDRVYYGVVRNVHNDGDNAIIQAVEYSKQYSQLDIKIKVLRGEKDYLLFPATPEDLAEELDGIVAGKERDIKKKQQEIAQLQAEIEEVEKLQSGETLRDLRNMSYSELTQAEFEAKQLKANQYADSL